MSSKAAKEQEGPQDLKGKAKEKAATSGSSAGRQEAEQGEIGADLSELEKDVAELRAIAEERDRVFDRLQRVTAELENYRKRVQREREQWRQYALEDFLKDFLTTIDNFERAREAARESGDLEALLEGLDLVGRELAQTLTRYGVSPIEALGRPFDPFEHEAVEVEPAGARAPGMVTAVLQRGYHLHDRVLRPSRVRVTRGPQEEAPTAEEGDSRESPSVRGAELDIT